MEIEKTLFNELKKLNLFKKKKKNNRKNILKLTNLSENYSISELN